MRWRHAVYAVVLWLVLVGALLVSAHAAQAQDAVAEADSVEQPGIAPDVRAWADWLGLDRVDLQGAVFTTGMTPEDYLVAVGHVERQEPTSPPWVTPRGYLYAAYPAWAARMDCIVRVESSWVPRAWNPMPWGRWGEHAAGLGGFLPSTFYSVMPRWVDFWDPVAQLDAMAEMIRRGRIREFGAIQVGLC